MLLNIAAFTTCTRVLGPGYRAAVWVMGCPFHCDGCIAKDWIEDKPGLLIEPQQLALEVLKDPKVTGITLSGGEPFQQAEGLAALVRKIREIRPVDVICYTGYTLQQLKIKPPTRGTLDLLAEVDVLIDGLYVKDLNDNVGLRGSSNQRIHFLTNRWNGYPFEKLNRSLEIQYDENNELFIVGIPFKGFDHIIDQALAGLIGGKVKELKHEWT